MIKPGLTGNHITFMAVSLNRDSHFFCSQEIDMPGMIVFPQRV